MFISTKFIFISMLLIGIGQSKKLTTIFEWQIMDFKYPTTGQRDSSIEAGDFIPKNVIPGGIEVAENRLFVTLPRYKPGVPVSLAYINLSDSETTKSPALTPYPDWQTIVNSPTAIKADRCKNLWVVDDIKAGGYILLRFNLTSDVLSERYPVPRELIKPNSNITSIAIEDEDCENLYVYMADSGASKLIVSQIKGNQTWAVNHHFFSTDPVSGNFSVGGIKYQTTDGITGLWLSEKKSNGFADLYFHPLSSNNEFKISTKLLHDNKTLPAYSDLELIGNRGQDRQAGASAYSQKAGVVFYAMVNKNQLSCWRLSNTAKYADAVVNVHNDSIEMIYPSDIKVSGGDVYVLTNNLPAFVHDEIKGDKINYRIFKSSVSDAISDTDCKKSIKDHINSAVDKITNFVPGNKDTTKPNNSNSLQPMTTIIFGAILFALIKLRNF